jgi:hypothetical protein
LRTSEPRPYRGKRSPCANNLRRTRDTPSLRPPYLIAVWRNDKDTVNVVNRFVRNADTVLFGGGRGGSVILAVFRICRLIGLRSSSIDVNRPKREERKKNSSGWKT